jgi:hypothetical protein
VHHRYQRHRWQIITSVNNTGGKIAAGINNTGGKFATDINNTGGKFATSFASVVEYWELYQIMGQYQAAGTLK